MILIYLNLFLTAIIVTYINIYFAKIDTSSTINIFKAAMYMAPLQILVGLGYSFYYSKGIETLSYATLNLSAYPLMISMGLISHILFFKGHSFSMYEIIGIILTGLGMIFFILNTITKGGAS